MGHSSIKILCLFLVAVMAFSLSGCRKKTTNETADTASPDSHIATADETHSSPDEAVAHTQPPTQPAPTQPPTSPSREEILSGGRSDSGNLYDATGFVSISDIIPDIQLEIRYHTSHNFVGDPINGYDEPIALCTKEAAAALTAVADELRAQGYLLKIYDAYRPQRAVDHFVSWANDWDDTRMKSEFYPDLDKSVLFSYGYIAYQSGHSRGSTFDLTLVDAASGEDVDMGGSFDYFGQRSHPDYSGVTTDQYQNRMTLRNAMVNHGFSPLSTEWWHFTLNSEPYPYTYFNFTVSTSSLNRSQ